MHIQSIGSKLSGWLLLFVCLFFSWQAKGQEGFESRIIISVDDSSVKATVDKPNASQGDVVTLTLTGLTSGKTAVVTAGSSAGATGLTVESVSGNSNTYTITMPSGILYINVKVTKSGQVIRVQTPGISSTLALVTLSVEGETLEAGNALVDAGVEVTATLTLKPEVGQTLTLVRITGQSPDGSWVMMPVELPVSKATEENTSIQFTMPASEVILTYTISASGEITTKPTEDSDDKDPVKVPEVAWPNNPGTPQEPVLVITREIEDNKLELLNKELQQLPVATEEEGAIIELVDISLQVDGKRVQPGSPVTVTYPYPQGTNADWNFSIVHQISDKGGDIEYETIYPQSLHIGLRFEVSSFSPFAIIYTPPVVPESGPFIPVKGISLDKTTLTLRTGNSESLQVTFDPETSTDQRIVWSSDNESVLAVSEEGVVTAKAAGSAVVTARSKNGGFTATCRVTVTSGSAPGPDPGPAPDPDPDPTPDPDDPTPPEPPVANGAIADGVPSLRVSEGCLLVEAARPVTVQVFGLGGQAQAASASAASHRISLPSGIWLVSIDRAKAVKIIIP